MYGRIIIPLNALILTALLATGRAAEEDDADAAETVWSDTGIAAVLESRCIECHSGETQEAGLNLEQPSGILRGGESGPVVLAGRPDESLLLERVVAGEMPPDEPLPAEEISSIREWIIAGAPHLGADAEPVPSEHRIEALMLLRCAACHGERRREANLDLRTKTGMLAGGDSGPAVVSGEPGQSRMVKRIHSGAMPPPRQLVSVSVKPMTPDELQLLEAWIAAGLPENEAASEVSTTGVDSLVSDEDRQFWSFQPPQQVRPPDVLHAERVDNPGRRVHIGVA